MIAPSIFLFSVLLLTHHVVATSSIETNDNNNNNSNNRSTAIADSYNYLRKATSTAVNDASNNKTACEIIESHDLPSECKCRQPNLTTKYNLIVECQKEFNSTYFNDTVGFKIDLEPCDPQGSRVSFDITESNYGIDYSLAGIRAGEEKNYPIPGWSIGLPGVGNVGLDATVLLYGNPDLLTVKIGLNACAQVGNNHREICASSLPGLNGVLPWYVMSDTYSFGDFCKSFGEQEVVVVGGGEERSIAVE